MVDDDIIQEWLQKAEEDFQFAIINLGERRPFHAQICFHFHQSVEKYLKTYIIAHQLEFRKTHGLPLLLNICFSHDPSFEELKDDCEYLNTFYIEARYPVHWPTHFSKEETEKARQAAQRIQSFVKKKLRVT